MERGGLGLFAILTAVVTATASHNQRTGLSATTDHGEAEASEPGPSWY